MTPRPHAKTHGAERGLRASKVQRCGLRDRPDPADRRDQGAGVAPGAAGLHRSGPCHGGAVARASGARALLYRHRRLLAAAPLLGADLRRSDHWFGAINLLFLLAIVVVPYPIRIWVFHLGTAFEPVASVVFTTGVALIACAWMAKWFYGVVGRRTMDERLAADFIQQMTRRYGLAASTQIVAVPISAFSPRIGVAVTLLAVAFFFLPQPRPRYHPGEEPSLRDVSDG